ncbi:VanZ family protein [Clostridium carboxidivorans P7]|uniref:VanZ family protein n=1 Tax=Clostridium carboxidivorans P7 TaxID=536227 RepID=C6PS08_9CLOT|nr:VanZ family protein [Clostridium carboxidivorans]AKN31940.1 VanZ family protein [Clostridium carboxidivorans P7]EET87933.1 VanZ family protein [Clostridium carboxidivorans P7]
MRKILSWIAVILWMALIFKLSSQPAEQSGKLSTGVTEINIKAIEKVNPSAKFNIKQFDHIIRKNAHFFVYLVLGIFVINALRRSGVTGIRCIVFALLICILYAISDEIHQIFVPGRGAQVKDVIIDSVGAAVGIGGDLIRNRINTH